MEAIKSNLTSRAWGGILLVAGCCIGAGMLGLPVVSAMAGFIPTTLLFIVVWGFMCATGLLLLEVNLWFPNEVSIISMAGHTLGRWGQAASWLLFCYLFYSIMVAYVDASGALLAGVADDFGLLLPKWVGSVGFTLFFGLLIFVGTGAVDKFNRILMLGLVLSYAGLVVLGIRYVHPDLLLHKNWTSVAGIVPIMIISFGYHNLVPSLTTYLRRDRKALISVIFWGSLLPLVIYLLWVGMVLGIVPAERFAQSLGGGDLATQSLKEVVGSPSVLLFAENFAFFAIVSSFLSVALSFVDFLADGFGISKTPKGKTKLILMTLLPSFVFAFLYPGIFLTALSYAGAFGTVVLFGILPALMAWKGRTLNRTPILPGGKVSLVAIILFAVAVIFLKIAQDLGVV
ncbi:MAG: tyrosine transporter [Chlamydiia bacterium]|nr:tyrosine transporter [Chlamydiia bacterium]